MHEQCLATSAGLFSHASLRFPGRRSRGTSVPTLRLHLWGGVPLRQDLSTSKGLGTQNSVSALTHETRYIAV